jgi:hypothetical protein
VPGPQALPAPASTFETRSQRIYLFLENNLILLAAMPRLVAITSILLLLSIISACAQAPAKICPGATANMCNPIEQKCSDICANHVQHEECYGVNPTYVRCICTDGSDHFEDVCPSPGSPTPPPAPTPTPAPPGPTPAPGPAPPAAKMCPNKSESDCKAVNMKCTDICNAHVGIEQCYGTPAMVICTCYDGTNHFNDVCPSSPTDSQSNMTKTA